ncbi:uncharacterized protein LOC103308536 [Acyrthosiphon pisum]|uniref:ATP-dependent DNA helicase n=1 Tax=Acyrthosiphon pisum TaxID=7029 RepID=A0A8R1X1N0_ACYPI|nr:uncharacterized protein LOC103308536 [Acyrthosiphon pisum]|eukprot:XP_008180300.1 PREDICTED: ATP-dependent DNA helicase pif1-like [Acyrthosiphon pisum]
MNDLKNNTRLFGGALLLLSGDFRQSLPVIPRATHADEINACIKQSYLWRNVSTLRLNTNIRVQLQNDPLALSFSEQLLNIGNGTIPLHGDIQRIELPDNFCNMVNTRDALIESIFPDLQAHYINHAWLRERAILAAKNINVDAINFKIQQSLPGNEILFKSIDTVTNPDEAINYPVEFLNSLDLPGMPLHNLRLKIGSPIIFLRNLNAPKQCNGTRLVTKKIMGNVLEATILNGKFEGEVVLLPRIPMIHSDSLIPFRRLQFPIRFAFAMTINKSQGQTMSICGLDLDNPVFSQGQLYVACSHVGKPSSCSWSKKIHPSLVTTKTIDELYPVPQDKVDYCATVTISNSFKDSVFSKLTNLGILVGLTWLLFPEPEFIPVVELEDIIRSSEFEQSNDKQQYLFEKIGMNDGDILNWLQKRLDKIKIQNG